MIGLHFSKYIIANSSAGLRANLLKRGYVLYNGIDKDFFENRLKSTDAINLRESKTDSIIISVSNFVPYKDYDTVFKALEGLKNKGYNYLYIIIGDGPQKQKIVK